MRGDTNGFHQLLDLLLFEELPLRRGFFSYLFLFLIVVS
ncbi:hypothetical protein HMPREF1319_1128 [Capnocytophaga ochracea str. Holt 25]|nr:hypothetical protein HMPREF1319_1128 [Capnocytophaga ochracea str. Holt 25]